MKASNIFRISLSAIILLMVFTLSTSAGKPAMTPAEHVQKMIKESIKYPEQAVKNCCQGSVEVVFTLDEDGRIVIKDSFSTEPQIEKYVKEQLATLCCKGIKAPYNEHYKVRISFKLIG